MMRIGNMFDGMQGGICALFLFFALRVSKEIQIGGTTTKFIALKRHQSHIINMAILIFEKYRTRHELLRNKRFGLRGTTRGRLRTKDEEKRAKKTYKCRKESKPVILREKRLTIPRKATAR